jgi:hypothetical protein
VLVSPTSLPVDDTATLKASDTAQAVTPPATAPAPVETQLLPGTTLTPVEALNQQMELVFPLQVANSWVYDYQGYSGDTKAGWQVIDTMLEERQQNGLLAIKVERSVTLTSGTPGKDFINPPQAADFWYVLDGTHIYRQDELDWSKMDGSWLELTWPFPQQGCWYPDPTQRSTQAASIGQPGCRSAGDATAPVAIQTPSGLINGCYHLDTPYNDGPVRLDFCEQVGIVGGEFKHNGNPYGYEYTLLAYSLQNK